jgi:hypothetical protein
VNPKTNTPQSFSNKMAEIPSIDHSRNTRRKTLSSLPNALLLDAKNKLTTQLYDKRMVSIFHRQFPLSSAYSVFIYQVLVILNAKVSVLIEQTTEKKTQAGVTVVL